MEIRKLATIFIVLSCVLSSVLGAVSGDLLEEISRRKDLKLFQLAIKYGRVDDHLTATTQSLGFDSFIPLLVFAPNNYAMIKAGYTEKVLKAIAEDDGFVEDVPNKRSYKLRTLVEQHLIPKTDDYIKNLNPNYRRMQGTPIKTRSRIIYSETVIANILEGDIKASNGIIHVIDNILD